MKDLSGLQIGMLDMVKAAKERFEQMFPGRTAKYFYAPEPILQLIAKAILESGTPLPTDRTVVQCEGMDLGYSQTTSVMVSDLTAKEINGALVLSAWDTEGRTKQ